MSDPPPPNLAAETSRLVLRALETTRRIVADRAFGQLDRALGCEPGYLNRVFRGHYPLPHDRFFTALDFLGWHLLDFIAMVFPRRRDHPSPVGFLLRRKERREQESPLSFHHALIDWGKSVVIRDDGAAPFLIDFETFDRLCRIDTDAAFDQGRAALRGVVALAAESLEPDTADKICRILVPLAHILRNRGYRNAACDLIDLGFRIEQRLDRPSLRGLLFRSGAYLLSDLGCLADAELFASHAVDLAVMSAETLDIGRSLYVQGLIVDRLGELNAAIRLYSSAADYLKEDETQFRASVLHGLAKAHIRNHQPNKASDLLLEAQGLFEALHGRELGQWLTTKAELASFEGRNEEAESFFDDAEQAFGKDRNTLDLAILLLTRAQHRLDSGDEAGASKITEKLAALTNELRGNPTAGNFLLELARSAARGSLTSEAIHQTREPLLRPWDFERRR